MLKKIRSLGAISLVLAGMMLGIILVFAITLVWAKDNDDSILVRLKRLEDKVKYYEERVTVAQNGNIGIGTNIPQNKLQIQNGKIEINANYDGSNQIIFRPTDTTAVHHVWELYPQPEGFGILDRTTGKCPLFINNNGNVSINGDYQQVLRNLAYGKQTLLSSPYPNGANPPNLGVDGNLDSFFHTFKNDEISWWEVDLGKQSNILQIIVHRHNQYLIRSNNSLVMISTTPFPNNAPAPESGNDGVFRKDLFVGDTNTSLIDSLQIDVEKKFVGVVGRFVRIQTKRPACLHLTEVEILGYQRP